MSEKITILPVRSLADAEREIEKLARRLERVLAQPVFDPTAPPTGPAGGVLSGGYPNPGFAVDMATQAELDAAIAGIPPVDLSPYRIATAQDVIDTASRARVNHTGTQLASTISDFASAARAQTEAELVAGTGMTITPSGSGASRILTLDAAGGGAGSGLYTVWDPLVPDVSPHALSDEYDANSLASYIAVYGNGDSTALVDINTTKPGAAYFAAPSIQYHQHSLLKALPAGDFSIFVGVSIAAGQGDSCFVGPILSTGSTAGSGVGTANTLGRSSVLGGIQFVQTVLWNGFGSSAAGASGTGGVYCEYPLVVLRIRRVGSVVTRSHSQNGINWAPEVALTNAAWTHFGVMFQNYLGQVGSASVEFLRYYPIGTQLITGGARTVGGSSGGGGGSVDDKLLGAFISTGAETSNQITTTFQTYKADGTTVQATDMVEVVVKVTDAADDFEPSATATLSAGGLGTLLGGNGSATAVFRTDVNGQLSVIVTETAVAHRYLWISTTQNTRKFLVAKNTVHELIFT